MKLISKRGREPNRKAVELTTPTLAKVIAQKRKELKAAGVIFYNIKGPQECRIMSREEIIAELDWDSLD